MYKANIQIACKLSKYCNGDFYTLYIVILGNFVQYYFFSI